MPDKKVATQASDGPWERETIITFNDAEKKASYYTCNKARMEQLKELAKEYPDAVKITRDEDWCMDAQEMGQNQAASQADRRAICGTGQTRQRTCRAAATGKELSEGIIRLHMPKEEDIKCIILTAH